MFRLGSVSLFGMALIACAVSSVHPSDDPNFNKALSVQSAMVRARTLLTEKHAKSAVETLEEELPKVNNNPQYLTLLRDAYRAYIRDLYLAEQPELARRYLDRLCILDPSAAADATLRPQAEVPPRKFEQPEAPKQTKQAFPNWKMPALANPFAKKEEPEGPLPKATIRLLGNNASGEDPFEKKHQREMPLDTTKAAVVRDLLSRGADEFKLARYTEAKTCFEQAYQTEPTCLEVCKEQWAYCIIKGVTESMDQPGMLPGNLIAMRKQVDAAMQMAPTKMQAVGQELLQTLEQRSKAGAPPQVSASVANVRHLGKNREGWDVTATPHFRIFHKQDNEFAQRVAQIAESTRTTMYRKWFGTDGADWEPTCELILHPNAADYTQMTGVPSNSPGHSRIESDPSGRVISRRMDLRNDIAGMMDAVLPHEATHVVLAGMFDANHVPRWADEGIAVLSEPNEKIEQHRRNLHKHHKEEQLFGLKELMELKDYPHPRRIGAFYAQSVVLVEFLAQQRGPKVLTEFIKDGLRHGYETSLQRHYSMTFIQLEQAWQQQVISGVERVAVMK